MYVGLVFRWQIPPVGDYPRMEPAQAIEARINGPVYWRPGSCCFGRLKAKIINWHEYLTVSAALDEKTRLVAMSLQHHKQGTVSDVCACHLREEREMRNY